MNKQSEELACLYVLDQLEGEERARFEERLLREPDLAEFVRDLDPALARGIDSLPRRDPPDGALNRIEARIDWMRVNERAAEDRKSVSRDFDWLAIGRWSIATAIAISLSVIALNSLLKPAAPTGPVVVFVGLDANRTTVADVPLKVKGADPDSRFMQLATLAENFWQKPADRPVASASNGNRAYALFDPASRQGFIAVEKLPVISDNERYHLWIGSTKTGHPIDAGELPMNGMDRGFYSFSLDPSVVPASGRPDFFITVEPLDESQTLTQPQGRVVLGRNDI